MNDSYVFAMGIVFLVMTIASIVKSQKRLRSFVYACAAFALVVVLGMIATFVLMPAHADLIRANEILDKVGRAIRIAAPLAAFFAADLPPRRVKA